MLAISSRISAIALARSDAISSLARGGADLRRRRLHDGCGRFENFVARDLCFLDRRLDFIARFVFDLRQTRFVILLQAHHFIAARFGLIQVAGFIKVLSLLEQRPRV